MTYSSNEDEVRALIRNWEHGIQQGDMGSILARHSDDVVMYDVPEPLQSEGIDAYRSTWELFVRYGTPAPDLFVIEDLVVIADEAVAFAFGILRIGGAKAAGCRLTLGLQKREGQWLIRHEHHSAPHSLAPDGESE